MIIMHSPTTHAIEWGNIITQFFSAMHPAPSSSTLATDTNDIENPLVAPQSPAGSDSSLFTVYDETIIPTQKFNKEHQNFIRRSQSDNFDNSPPFRNRNCKKYACLFGCLAAAVVTGSTYFIIHEAQE